MKHFFNFFLLLQIATACIPYNRDPELDATLEKLYTINEQMHQSIAFYHSNTERIIVEMVAWSQQHSENEELAARLLNAQELYKRTAVIVTSFDRISQRIVELSGGYNEQGRLVGGLDHAYHEDYTIGPKGSASGEAYVLAELLRKYKEFIQSTDDKAPLPNIKALSAESTDTDFVYFHFKNTPTITCLMTLASIEWEITRNEYEVVKQWSGQIGSTLEKNG